jgi:HAE1 family hydrophobic/amphiphilic exporter-1
VITLVDVVVFLPISFLPGTIGRFFSEFGLCVVVATLTSLAVSFTVTPALAGNWSLLSKWRPPGIINAFTRLFERIRRAYVGGLLEWGLKHPRWVIAISAVATLGALSLVPLGFVGFEFMPPVDRGEIFLQLNFPTGTPLSETNAAIADLTSRIQTTVTDLDRQTGTAGSFQAGFGGGVTQGSVGQIHVFLTQNRAHPTEYWANQLSRLARQLYPGAKPVAIPATGFGGGNAQPIDYLVESADDNPDPYAAKVLAVMEKTPGIAHANSSAANLEPQVDVVFDRERARALNVDIASAANAIRAAFGGSLAAQFFTARGVEYVQVIWPASFQSSVRAIAGIPFRTRSGSIAHVGDVAQLVNDPNPPLITRVNRQSVVHVSANMTPGAAQSIVQKAFLARLAALHLPSTVRVIPNVGGQQQNLTQTVQGLGTTLLLSFVLVYLLMLGLYDSYRLPFIIMFAVPVAAVGAVGSLALTHQALNLYSLIGTVLLVGLVSKNGILLVDFANHRVRAGIDPINAIRESAKERFRPIVMTTFSMIAGMTPIAFALDPGSQSHRALGTVVIGGLTSSLLLTLVLVPVAFVWFAPRKRPAAPPRHYGSRAPQPLDSPGVVPAK